ncbi:thioredoxin family protein [Enterococcus saccharolyticus]|uniref:Thioredoxin domain-containing protein n=1 Tax=Enterococcus saccharolyticus subsp. saccharolyticus ATCC 43076 TaxID=1139996 RepID=S0NGG9_9ENTE|nr:thioredoxin family protein [Enterococcus saccharolyticus]EOT29991.1 hypothetical protein OMQ_00683 [Enterococcus saccharolyticus subsp. saccharolyticus ATCC 43076]EOT80537.1 hypothetical protein I572_01064 [Enterococcus saccharolyticus subsp. saccharolyticus ATCC 43076]OJG90076.1 hypothetical protein RV16_GL001886 [Enterococcus saccharolyticus]
MKNITFTQTQEKIATGQLMLLYLSMPHCNVCHAVKPQVEKLFAGTSLQMFHLDAHDYPEVASTFQVLTAPVILVFFEGKEVHRQARFIDFQKLEQLVKNYQSMNLSVSYDELFN